MLLFTINLNLLWLSICHSLKGPHHPSGHHQHHSPQVDRNAPKLTQDTQLLRDVEHIKEDFEEQGFKTKVENMSPEELEFHYFKLHDFDNNSKLDGLEILKAIQHTVHETGADENEHEGSETQFQYFIDLIDQVLAEDDQDNDGFLSYGEYVIGRQRERQNLQHH